MGGNTPADWVPARKLEWAQRVRCSPRKECFQHPRFGCECCDCDEQTRGAQPRLKAEYCEWTIAGRSPASDCGRNLLARQLPCAAGRQIGRAALTARPRVA